MNAARCCDARTREIAIPTVDTDAVTCADCAGTGTQADWAACCARCEGRGAITVEARPLVVRTCTAVLRVAMAILRDQADSARAEMAMFQWRADRAQLEHVGRPEMFDGFAPARGAA